VDLVAILDDVVVREEPVVHWREVREVLEVEVLGVQVELGEETLAEVSVAVEDPHAHQIIVRRGGLTVGAQGRKHGTAVVTLVDHLAGGQSAHVASPRLKPESPTIQGAEVVRVELKRKRPVGVLQVINDSLGRRAHLLGVELHCHVDERLQTLCLLFGTDLATVLHEFVHLVGRKECGHFGAMYTFQIP